MELIFATHNQNKVKEISAILPSIIKLKSLNDLNFTDQIPEKSKTLKGNALFKARTIFNEFQRDCFADDTGLEVGPSMVLLVFTQLAMQEIRKEMRIILISYLKSFGITIILKLNLEL